MRGMLFFVTILLTVMAAARPASVYRGTRPVRMVSSACLHLLQSHLDVGWLNMLVTMLKLGAGRQ